MNETNERMTTLALVLKTRERWLLGIESLAWLVVILAAFLGNVMLTLAVFKSSRIRSPQNYYLLSLAATDVFNATAIMPYTLTVLIKGTWPFGNFICQLQGSLTSICATVSLLTMALISFNRYVKIVSYYKVFRKIRAHYAQVASSGIRNENSAAFAEEVKITAMLFVTVLTFFICWVPSFIIDFYEAIAGYYTLPRQLYLFNIFTYTSSSAINPFIYGFMNRDFRGAYMRILCCKES
ncbi:hypothetical protein pdam_00004481 [Pocillopora damicornis]|uniref:G-protein coupled receptors family 1 profile domain-containing protein n=1 Tax=Pocillopora damicornis TaxID=46731 RepID=A0A3M6URP5_POCDA|nr:hypothetical protein pdam_00004481 [Pocillopora damicornis]